MRQKEETYADNKKLLSLPEVFRAYVQAFRAFPVLKKGRKSGLIDEKFQERLMLAVTAVNKCPLCSYAHAEAALKAGLKAEEIKSFVDGDFPDIPLDEVKAILFAQQYADARGKLKKEAWEALENEYGSDKAQCILATVRIISMGNAMGIVFSSFGARFKKGKESDPRSSFGYELLFILCLLPLLIFGTLGALIANLIRLPRVKF